MSVCDSYQAVIDTVVLNSAISGSKIESVVTMTAGSHKAPATNNVIRSYTSTDSVFEKVDIPTTVIVLTNSSLPTTDSEYHPKLNYSHVTIGEVLEYSVTIFMIGGTNDLTLNLDLPKNGALDYVDAFMRIITVPD